MEPGYAQGSPVEKDIGRLCAFFRVLGEPNRLRVMRILLSQERCVCELLPEIGISQPLLSHHLSVLSEAGLIRARRQAQRIYYSVVPETLAQLKSLLLEHLDPDTLPAQAVGGSGIEGRPVPELPAEQVG